MRYLEYLILESLNPEDIYKKYYTDIPEDIFLQMKMHILKYAHKICLSIIKSIYENVLVMNFHLKAPLIILGVIEIFLLRLLWVWIIYLLIFY